MQIKNSEFFINLKSLPPKESKEFEDLVDWEMKKCLEGTTIAGVYIPGWLYFHLNHWWIRIDDQDAVGNVHRIESLPLLRDNEWIRAEHFEECRKQKKAYIEIGARQGGKSEMEASYTGYNSLLFQNSQNIIVGSNSKDIDMLKDKVDFGLKKMWEGLYIPRLDKTWRGNQVRLGYKKKDGEDDIWSVIIIRNTDEGKNTEVAAGTTAKGFVYDEAGKADWMKSYEAAKPAFSSDFGLRAIPIVVGTGGSFEKGEDAERVFYNPEANGFLGIEDPLTGKKTGLFISGLYRREFKYETTLAEFLRKKRGVDIPENTELDIIPMKVTDEDRAKEAILSERELKKKDADQSEYLKVIMYSPLTVEECFMRKANSVFNTMAAKAQQQRIYNNNIESIKLFLHHDGEKVDFEYSNKRPISRFPHDHSEDLDAPIQVWEMPINNPAFSQYIIGCLPPGEKVLTGEGLKNIEDITEADNLINENGKEVSIKTFMKFWKENENLYEIKLSNTFRTTKFTGEHPIWSSRSVKKSDNSIDVDNLNFKFTEASLLEKGDWVRVPNIYKEEATIDFNKHWSLEDFKRTSKITCPLDNKDFWWFVGLWLGDGWCESNNYKISVAFNNNETELIEKFKTVVKSLFKRSTFIGKVKNGSCEIGFSHQVLSNFLNKNFGKYAKGKLIPEWAKRIKKIYKENLIVGYLDSDGCVTRSGKKKYFSTEFVSINLKLLEDIQDILFSLGYISGLSRLRHAQKYSIAGKKESNIAECYHLRLSNTESVTMASNFLDKGMKLSKININNSIQSKRSKKGCFLSPCGNYIYFSVTDVISHKYTGLVYNFECDTHTYMCHHLVTHNCDPYSQTDSKYSKSLGAAYVFKRISNITDDKYQYRFVASYVARPDSIDKFHEQVRLLIKWYNALTFCENDVMLFIEYMKAKGDAHYLQPQPEWLKSEIHQTSSVNRSYGIHSTPQIIAHRDGHLKKYLDDTVVVEKDENGSVIKELTGVSYILDPMLLEEIIKHDPTDKNWNGDRIVAAGLAITLANHMSPLIGPAKVNNNSKFDSYYNQSKKSSSIFGSKGSLFGTKKKKRLF